jgi:hypothetical protein
MAGSARDAGIWPDGRGRCAAGEESKVEGPAGQRARGVSRWKEGGGELGRTGVTGPRGKWAERPVLLLGWKKRGGLG